MLLSLKWLHELTPYEVSVEELAQRLTMLGLEVEEISNPFSALEPVSVGLVQARQPHPNADNLSVCLVDVGEVDPLEVVCGAPNVASGQKVALAPVGMAMPNGQEIKKAKIRGQTSMGMICSEKELGLGEDASGIMVLDSSLVPGTSLVEALDLETTVFDLGITPNRADCLSVLGVAREVAAAYDLPINLPQADIEPYLSPERLDYKIEIKDGRLCPLYQALALDGVHVGQSPAWMRYRLLAIGQRPINNIVDITNYVLFEQGQPLHAFDRDRLEGEVIRVALAESGQSLTTLDGQERRLESNDLLIWDQTKPVALAGVMGGANSEMQADSSRVLLEGAVFHPGTIRKTARRLALPSEASYRFERGVDQPGSSRAMRRAASLMAEASGGRILRGMVSNEPRPWQTKTLSFRPQRTREFLALDVEDDFCRQTLLGLGCELDASDPEGWKVQPPSYRLDLEREVDLSEEIARVYGMDQIPVRLPRVKRSLEASRDKDGHFEFLQWVKDWAAGVGLNEVVNYSFVGASDLDSLGLPSQRRIAVKNPLSADQDTMRTNLAPGLLQCLGHNLSQGNVNLRLFEVAHTFQLDPSSETTAQEIPSLGLLLTGRRLGPGWPNNDQLLDYADIKGLIEHLLASVGRSGRFELSTERPHLDPEVVVLVDGQLLGSLGRIKTELARGYRARDEVWLAEIDLMVLGQLAHERVLAFRDLPKFPPVQRDMTVIAPPGLRLDQITSAVFEQQEGLLEDLLLVDVYRPQGQEETNFTFRLTYRHGQKTLKDKEVDKVHTRIGQRLLEALPVRFS